MSRILIVEDEDIMSAMLRDVLEGEGHEVFEARNGKDGLKLLAEHKPDVVLLDLMLPILDGTGFLEGMRQESAHTNPPVIAMTSMQLADAERRAFAGYLFKPFKLEELLRTLGRVLPSP
jgi:CheY-like chemotaxis protein